MAPLYRGAVTASAWAVYARRVDASNPSDIAQKIAELRVEHRDLDDAIARHGQTLALASTTGGLWISADAGEHWTVVSNDLPPVAMLRFV